MNTNLSRHFYEEVKAQVVGSTSIKSFIETETTIKSSQWSWEGHEYQLKVLELFEKFRGRSINVQKPSQCGISEIVYRYILALMKLEAGSSVLLSFPTRDAASEMLKTRVDGIIDGSNRLRSNMDNHVDNALVKRMNNGSTIYAVSGAEGSRSSLLSRDTGIVVVDEVDRQSKEVISAYPTRQTHTKPHKRVNILISTPTVPGIGISAEIDESRVIYYPLIVCETCSHEFDPDFFEDVVVPGFNGKMRELTKKELAKHDPYSAYLRCPACGGEVVKREYVWKEEHRDHGSHSKVGLTLNPFIMPSFIPISDLVISYVDFADPNEFLQQKLGKPSSLSEASITREKIKFEHCDPFVGRAICGVDFGKLCHLLVGYMRVDTSIHITEAYVVKLSEFEEFFEALNQRIVFTTMCCDAGPYSDLVYRLIKKYPRLYSCIYTKPAQPTPELWKLTLTDRYDETVRQAAIQKNVFMSHLASSVEHFFTFEPTPLQETIIQHITDMRKVKDPQYYDSAEGKYMWVKSEKGVDHFWHSLCYLFMASKLASTELHTVTAVTPQIRKINPEMRRQAAQNRLP